MTDRQVQIKSKNGDSWDNIYPKTKADIVETSYDKSFISEPERKLWNGKADISYVDNKVKTDVPVDAKFTDTIVDISGKADISYVDNKVKTDVPVDAKFTDTVYTHPTTAGNKHIPTGGASDQFLKYSASGTAIWSPLPESEGPVYRLPQQPRQRVGPMTYGSR